jgi:hypothetical protein
MPGSGTGTPASFVNNRYATVAEAKTRLGIDDTVDDTIIGQVLDAVSRSIDEWTGRYFYSATETRYYTSEWDDLIQVDDLVSVTSIGTDEDNDRVYEKTWSVTDYDLYPHNAEVVGKPYSRIYMAPNGLYSFPASIAKGVKLIGSFGWPAVPAPVKEATLIQAGRIFKRKDAPFGVTGSTTAEMGQLLVIPKIDPDVEMMLRPYRKMDIL